MKDPPPLKETTARGAVGALGICGWGSQLVWSACKIAQFAPVHPPRNRFPQVSLQGSCLPHRLQEEPHYWAPTCPSPRSTYAWHWKKLTRSWGKKTESQRHHLPTSTREYAGFFFSKAALSERVPVSPGSNLLPQSATNPFYLPTTPLPHFPPSFYTWHPEPRALTPGSGPLGVLLESSCSTSLPSLHSFLPSPKAPSRAPRFSSTKLPPRGSSLGLGVLPTLLPHWPS